MNQAQATKPAGIAFYEGQAVTWSMQRRDGSVTPPLPATIRKLGQTHLQIEIVENVRGELVRSLPWVSPATLSVRDDHAAQATNETMNRVVLKGNLGRAPEVRGENGTVCRISIATSSRWIDPETGEVHEDTDWHRVVFFNDLAKVAAEQLKKGDAVCIEGYLKTRKWLDKDTGAKRYTTEVVAQRLEKGGVSA